jgi:phage protein D
MSDVSYSIFIDDVPASPDLLNVIQQIEIEDHAEMADMLRMSVAIAVKDGCGGWNVIDDNTFHRLAKIRVNVNVGSGKTEPLIEAYVTEANANFANQPGQSVLDVVAMEPTVLMNLLEQVKAWPNMADSDIAEAIFNSYQFDPVVDQTQPSWQENDYTTVQRGTDIQFLQSLAKRNGYECYVELNPETALVEGHFHLPRLQQTIQGVLSVNLGDATNVNSFRARFDSLGPTTAKASNIDIESQDDQSSDVSRQALTDLGSSPSLGSDNPRQVLLSGTGLSSTAELQTVAQSEVDRSSWAITADGEVNTVAYGAVLRAKRPVLVRGAGPQFSGTYYVQSVTHIINGDGYAQQFSLKRNASGLTGQEQFAASTALPS